MEIERAPIADDCERDGDGITRRAALAHIYNSLPIYASAAFWHALEAADMPLEVLARCLRDAIIYEDEQGRNRLIELIVQRTQKINEYWATSLLRGIAVSADERYALMCDICADLYESMLRALLDPARSFWEENFLHCLRFERQHVYQAFMKREGRWNDQQVKKSMRIPRMLVTSLDQPIRLTDNETSTLDVEDERAQIPLQAVEYSDLLRLVLHLPERLRAVVLLIFWEGRTEKDTARLLGISDRTVRNRVRSALKLLRGKLNMEREHIYG